MSGAVLCLIVVVVLFLIIAVSSGSTASSTPPALPLPPPMPPPEPQPGGITVTARRGPNQPVPAGSRAPALGVEIRRPATVYVAHNQRDCPICRSSIDNGFQNKGWVRCQTTEKLIHAQCFEAQRAAGNAQCPSCHNCRPRSEGIGVKTA